MHATCAAILVGEYLMGIQPWWKSKSFIELALTITVITLVFIVWCAVIKPFTWFTKKGE